MRWRRAELPWIDWQNYWATGDASSRSGSLTTHLSPNGRGVDGALLDLEYQRMELIKFNLFDNSGTFEDYVQGRDGVGGPGAEGAGRRCGCRPSIRTTRRSAATARSSAAAS